MSGYGIVVADLSGGAVYSFVDEERWAQIIGVHAAVDEKDRRWKNRLIETVEWLTADDRPETIAPEGAPERRGRLLRTVYTQTFIVERAEGVEGRLLGVLTLP